MIFCQTTFSQTMNRMWLGVKLKADRPAAQPAWLTLTVRLIRPMLGPPTVCKQRKSWKELLVMSVRNNLLYCTRLFFYELFRIFIWQGNNMSKIIFFAQLFEYKYCSVWFFFRRNNFLNTDLKDVSTSRSQDWIYLFQYHEVKISSLHSTLIILLNIYSKHHTPRFSICSLVLENSIGNSTGVQFFAST